MAATGQTLPLEDLPEWSSDKVYKYPMVWLSPVTGERCFQMFPEVTHKLYLKDPPLGPERLIEDYEEIRVWLNEVLDRIAKPEYIMVPPCEEGDVVIWNNWVNVLRHDYSRTVTNIDFDRESYTVLLSFQRAMARGQVKTFLLQQKTPLLIVDSAPVSHCFEYSSRWSCDDCYRLS